MSQSFNLSSAVFDWLNDYAPTGIITTDTQLIIRSWNRWLEQHSGRTAASVIGRSLFDVFPELAARRFDRFYNDALRGEAKLLAYRFHRYLVKLPASSEQSLREMQQTARIAPLMDDGVVVGTITVIEDVSERVAREEELSAARHEAESANQAKDNFLAILSHDLRTPLNSILGWARLIRSRTFNQQTLEKGMETIERNALVQVQLIEQVLDISRIAKGKLVLEVEPIDLKEVLDAGLDPLKPMAESKGVRLECVMPRSSRITAADPKRFQQIIWNLVSNAVKFTPRDGTVRIDLEYHKEGFELRVADTGVGIAAEDVNHIFEPLWQSHDSVQGGLGLGLAIVHELVGLHGGSIVAESEGLGRGATFRVRVPWPEAASQSVGSK